MKNILIILALLALASPGLAQEESIFAVSSSSELWTNNCLMGPEGEVYTFYLYLKNGVNYDFDDGSNSLVQNVGGFECNLYATGTATILAKRFPVPAIDVGDPSMRVGFSVPVHVDTDGCVLLAEVDVLMGMYDYPGKASPVGCENATGFLHLDPSFPASIEGFMAYLDADDPDNDPIVPAYLPWTLYENIVYALEPRPVATEDRSWASIKAIFR